MTQVDVTHVDAMSMKENVICVILTKENGGKTWKAI